MKFMWADLWEYEWSRSSLCPGYCQSAGHIFHHIAIAAAYEYCECHIPCRSTTGLSVKILRSWLAGIPTPSSLTVKNRSPDCFHPVIVTVPFSPCSNMSMPCRIEFFDQGLQDNLLNFQTAQFLGHIDVQRDAVIKPVILNLHIRFHIAAALR